MTKQSVKSHPVNVETNDAPPESEVQNVAVRAPVQETAEGKLPLPPITVLVCTYNRFDTLMSTLSALHDSLLYPKDLISWLVCDDSSPAPYAQKIKNSTLGKLLNIEVVSTAENSGWAANVNNGLAHVQTEHVYFTEDDYVPATYIDLRAMVALTLVNPRIGMVRARGVAGTHVVAHLNEADISDYHPQYRDGMGVEGKMNYWALDNGSFTPYLYSNGPHLRTKAFDAFYGSYPLGDLLGATEERYAHTVKDKMKADPDNAPWIVIPPDFVTMKFDHIGKSFQLTDADKRH